MDRLIYTTLSGQKHIEQRIQQISNEIANVSTTGFKRAFAAATETYRLDGEGYRSRYVSVVKPSSQIDLNAGPMMTTGRNLDVALRGNQLFGVLTESGELAYTRRGDLTIDPTDRTLRTGSGERIASDSNGPITVPDLTELKIGPDGTVLTKQIGGEAVVFQPLARLLVVEADPAKVKLRTDGLYDSIDRQPFSPATVPTVSSGVLEGSNSNLFSSMVDMISMSRRYEMQVKMLKQASDLAERSQTLARVAQ